MERLDSASNLLMSANDAVWRWVVNVITAPGGWLLLVVIPAALIWFVFYQLSPQGELRLRHLTPEEREDLLKRAAGSYSERARRSA